MTLIMIVIQPSWSAQPQMTVQTYHVLIATGRQIVVDLYLEGMLESFEWVDNDYESEKPEKFFCLPIRRDLYDFQHIRDAIKDELAARPDVWPKDSKVSLAQVALEAFRRRYPCK